MGDLTVRGWGTSHIWLAHFTCSVWVTVGVTAGTGIDVVVARDATGSSRVTPGRAGGDGTAHDQQHRTADAEEAAPRRE